MAMFNSFLFVYQRVVAMRRDRSYSMIGRILKGLCPDDWGIARLLTGVSHQVFGGLGFAAWWGCSAEVVKNPTN